MMQVNEEYFPVWKQVNTPIFISASWKDRFVVKYITEHLEDRGIEVTEHWYDHTERGKWREYAESDKAAINRSRYFFLYNSNTKSSGKLIETGIAIQCGIPIYTFNVKITSVFRRYIKKHYNMKDWLRIAHKIQEIVKLE